MKEGVKRFPNHDKVPSRLRSFKALGENLPNLFRSTDGVIYRIILRAHKVWDHEKMDYVQVKAPDHLKRVSPRPVQLRKKRKNSNEKIISQEDIDAYERDRITGFMAAYGHSININGQPSK